jgi:hypothetical protein
LRLKKEYYILRKKTDGASIPTPFKIEKEYYGLRYAKLRKKVNISLRKNVKRERASSFEAKERVLRV